MGYFSPAKTFPRCLVILLYSWTAYVSITRVDSLPQIFTGSLIIGVLTIGLYTYIKLIVTRPGSPHDFPELTVHNLDAAENGTELPPEFLSKRSVTSKRDGRFRVCRTCQVWKPDRCHHCSACNCCVLKMDHHCPWIPDCVGFKNQKYFVQFLLFSTFYALIVFTVTTTQLFFWFHDGEFERELIDLVLLSVWLLSFAVCIAMLCFTTFSIYQLTKNQTTIEMHILRRYREELEILNGSYQSQDTSNDNVFSLGSPLNNWEDVMGTTWLEWCLPIPTSKSIKSRHTLNEKGLFFEFRGEVNDQLLENLSLQDRLLRRLTPRSSVEYS